MSARASQGTWLYKGFPETTRISSVVASAIATTEGQFLVSAKLNASAADNRRHFEGDNRFYWTSQDTLSWPSAMG